MFNCPNCKKETPKLMTSGHGLRCHSCFVPEKLMSCDTHVRIGTGQARSMTMADHKHIWSRTIGSDGKTLVYKNNPNKRWSW